MGRTPIRAKLVLDAEAKAKLESIAKSRTEGQARIERANVLLAYHAGERVTALAEAFHTNRPKIERILNRALEMGALASLEDRPGRGRKPEITPEAPSPNCSPAPSCGLTRSSITWSGATPSSTPRWPRS
jgi:hypothetical protein